MSNTEIIKNLFNGLTVKEAAIISGTSSSTVYNRINRFVKEVERIGMTEAANNHDVKEKVNNLMQLSRDLNENDLTIPDCVELINTIKSFKQKEIDFFEYDSFLDDFYIELKKRELLPSDFIKYASVLKELSESEGITYSELIDEISLNRNINNSLKVLLVLI